MEKMSKTKAIKTFFEKDGGRKVTISEFKDLSVEDKKELGELAAKELGVELA